MRKTAILVFIMFIICSCNKNSNSKIIADYIIKLTIDTVYIPINGTMLNTYAKASGTIIEGNEYLVGFNSYTHAIDLIDMSGKNSYSIKLQKKGPKGIGMVTGLLCLDKHILLKSNNTYLFINYSGELISKYKLNDFKGINKKEYMPSRGGTKIANFDRIVYDDENKIIYESLVPAGKQKNNKYYETYFIAKFNLIDTTSSFVPIKFPKIVKEEFWGNRDKVNISLFKHTIVFNFSFSAKIWQINNNQINEFSLNSAYTKSLAKPSDLNENPLLLMHNAMRDINFLAINYDKYRNLFYRIHIDEAKEKKTLVDRTCYLTISSHDFTKKTELMLPNVSFTKDYVILHGGVYFQLPENTKKGLTHIKLLRITPASGG